MYYFVERQTLYSRPDGLLQQIGRKKMNHEIAAKIVSEMTFSAAAYARDRSAFLAEALQRYREITGDDAPEAAAEMKAVLEQSFADRKALSVSGIDLPDHLRDGGRFRICVDGTEVTGRVRLSPKEMAVEITAPYQGRQAGATLQLLAPVIWTERPEAGSEANEAGREKAVRLLTDIYYTFWE